MLLPDYLRLLRRSLLLIVALVVAGGAAGYLIGAAQPPKYRSTAQAYVSAESALSLSDLSQGAAFAQQVVTSYADIATTAYVLDAVTADLGLHMSRATLAGEVSVVPATNETVIAVTVTDSSPTRAAAIANSVTTHLATAVADLTPDAGSKAAIKVVPVDPATPSSTSVAVSSRLTAIIGAVAGLLLAVVLAVLREILDTKVRTEDDATRATGGPMLGVTYRAARRRPAVVTDAAGRGVEVEAYRTLRNNMRFVEIGAKRSFVITSSTAAEGKTTTAVNLAVVLGDLGERVALVDADLRRPTVSTQLGLDGTVGLTDVLIGSVELDGALQAWGDSGLMVLPSGQVPPNPNEILQTQAMADLLDRLTERFDVVLLDTPPLVAVSDGAVLARWTTGAILVVASGEARRAEVHRALTVLERAGAGLVGVVLTKATQRGVPAYDYAARAPRAGVAGRTKRRGATPRAASGRLGAGAASDDRAPQDAPVQPELDPALGRIEGGDFAEPSLVDVVAAVEVVDRSEPADSASFPATHETPSRLVPDTHTGPITTAARMVSAGEPRGPRRGPNPLLWRRSVRGGRR